MINNMLTTSVTTTTIYGW